VTIIFYEGFCVVCILYAGFGRHKTFEDMLYLIGFDTKTLV